MGFGSTTAYRRTPTSLRFWLAIVMTIALSLVFALQFAHASADTTTNVVVHSSDVGTSWFSGPPATTRSGGSVSFVTGPGTAPLGNGSLHITTTDANGSSNAKAQMFNYSYMNTPLANITALSYSDYRSSSSTNSAGQRIGINIEIDKLGSSGFTTLVFEPIYQSGGIGALASDTWQSWDAINGGNGIWWSSDGTQVGDQTYFTWAAFNAAYPSAKIVGGLGFNAGSGWTGIADENADDLSVGVAGNTTIFDFEPTVTPTDNVQMTVLDSHGNPLAGATVYDQGTYLGNLGTTDANGMVSGTLPAGNYSFYATLDGTTSATYGPVAVTADAVTSHTFQTVDAQVNLQTCSGSGLAGGIVQYKAGAYTYYLGSATDANGVASQEIFPGSYLITMNYGGASNQATVDFGTTNPYTFNTNSVTLYNPGYITYTAPNGYAYNFSGPTMQMLPATYTFHASGTSFDVPVSSSCSAPFTGGVVRLVDHNGNGLGGGTASYYAGGWHVISGTTDPTTGDLVFTAPSTFSTISMTYKGAIVEQSRAQLTASNYTFQTVLTTVKLENADGNPLDTGSVTFYAGSWQPFGSGTTSSGQVATELLPGSYTFSMSYNGTQQSKVQNNSSDPVVVFQTGRLTLYYSAPALYSNSEFYNFVPPSMEFLPGTINIDVVGGAGVCKPSLTIAAGDHQVKSAVVATLKNHSGANVSGGQASAYVGGQWVSFTATTNTYGTACQLFSGQLGNVSVAMVYNGTREQLPPQNQPTNSIFAFQTDLVTVQLKNSTGALIDTGTASYYAGGWVNLGITHSGQIPVEMLPGTYSFAMVYNGTREQKNTVTVGPNTVVVFQTTGVTVQLQRSTGTNPPLSGGDASYYAGGWNTIGTTDNNGQTTVEMLTGSYSFAMVFNGTREQLNNVGISGTTTNVTFQTTLVSVLLRTPDGHSPVTDVAATASYYAGGWHTVATTNGYAPFLMLPGNYSFAMVYKGTREQIDNVTVGGATTNVEFLTTQVHSDTGTATSYYAGGWQPFTNDMYLLPGSYAFRFNDGFPQTPETLTGGTTSHIH